MVSELFRLVERPVRRVAANGPARPERDPHSTVVIDGEPVREAVGLVDLDERTAVRDVAVVVEDVDLRGERVDVVHEAIVRRPADAVRQANAGDDLLERRAVVAIERGSAGRLVEAHRPDPEAAAAVADAVVRPQLLVVRERDRRAHSLRADERQAVGQCDEELAVICGCDGTNTRADLDHAVHPVPRMNLAAFDVDPEETPFARVPARPLSEERLALDQNLDA